MKRTSSVPDRLKEIHSQFIAHLRQVHEGKIKLFDGKPPRHWVVCQTEIARPFLTDRTFISRFIGFSEAKVV